MRSLSTVAASTCTAAHGASSDKATTQCSAAATVTTGRSDQLHVVAQPPGASGTLLEAAPDAWLRAHYPPGHTATEPPSHVVLFTSQLASAEGWLADGGYYLSWDFLYAHFTVDNGHDARVLVFTNVRT